MSIAARVPFLLTIIFADVSVPDLVAEAPVVNQAPPPVAPRSGGCVIESSKLTGAELVATDSGIVRGAAVGGTYVFKGIPFAAPPLGERRWRPPQATPCWSGVRNATTFAEVCAQATTRIGATMAWFGSEDCLYLNVWTPRERKAGDRLPVLFFVHGGGNTVGSGSVVIAATASTLGANVQDGQRLAERGAIVVTSNYRLGMLGFLAHPALSRESETGASGNYALRDQIAALEWVQRNIANFGGDPSRVFAFGQSAGGRNICGLVAAQADRRWFSRAGILSGNCENFPSLEQAETAGRTWATQAGCDANEDVGCLRRLSTAQAVAMVQQPRGLFGHNYFQLGPIIDRVLIRDQPLLILRAPATGSVPLLVSSADNETAFALFPLMFSGAIETPDDFVAAVKSLAPAHIVAAIQSAYPLTEFATPRQALTALLTDANSVCAVRRTARAAAAGGRAVWRAAWLHTASNGPARPFGPAHVTDVAYWFDTLHQMPDFLPTAGEVALADAMSRSLIEFAATGDPNHSLRVKWPQYDALTDAHIALDDNIAVGSGFHSQRCDFWDTHLPPAGYRATP